MSFESSENQNEKPMYNQNGYQDKIIMISVLCSSFCMNEMSPEVPTGTDMLGERCRAWLIPILGRQYLPTDKQVVLGLVSFYFGIYSADRSLHASILN